MKDLDELKIEKEFEIHDESVFALTQELKDFSKKQAKYHRWAAQANKKVNKLQLVLKVVESTIFKELLEEAEKGGKPYPPSSYGEIRRMRIPLDERYQKAVRALYEAQETYEIVSGYLESWRSRGFRLMELCRINERLLWSEPVVTTSEEFKSLEEKMEEAQRNLKF